MLRGSERLRPVQAIGMFLCKLFGKAEFCSLSTRTLAKSPERRHCLSGAASCFSACRCQKLGRQASALPRSFTVAPTGPDAFPLWIQTASGCVPCLDERLRRDHRQPEREESGKRGGARRFAWLRCGKKGKKRHILVDTLGLLLSAAVHCADIQDRDGATFVLDARTRASFPFILRIFADAGYQGPRAALAAAQSGDWVIEVVKRSELHTFAVLPKRWIVERTIAWLGRYRRLAKDWENLNRKALGFLRLASIRLMLRKLCNPV